MKRHLENPVGHHAAYTCGAALLTPPFARRRFLQVAVGGFTAAALVPWRALAASGKYEAMVSSCIDPRFQDLVCKYTAGRHITGQHSQFTIAGAAIAVVAPAFKDWYKTFWDNLEATIELHGIDKVIVINHRDCGAVKMAYGEAAVADSGAETATHWKELAEFRKQLAARYPKLGVETGLMALDGAFEVMS